MQFHGFSTQAGGGFSWKSLATTIKPEASREILRPTPGLRMTDFDWSRNKTRCLSKLREVPRLSYWSNFLI